MEREVGVEAVKKVTMGADNHSSASSRLITLQNRKQMLEEKIAQKNQELRELCIQEAQLTSVMPPEVPLEPGETLPNFRRKVGTAFEYPPNLISKLNSEKESIAALETEIQFQRVILEDASRFATDAGTLKEKRKHMLIYEQTKHAIKDLEERLQMLKLQTYGPETVQNNQHLKQKKKPRPPFKYDTVSLKNNNFVPHGDDVNKNYTLHHNYVYQDLNHLNEIEAERYMTRNQVTHTNSYPEGTPQRIVNYNRPEYGLSYTLDRVPHTYNGAKDRRVSGCSGSPYNPQNVYTTTHPSPIMYQPHYSHTLPINAHMISPHTHMSPPMQYHSPVGMSQPNLTYAPPHTPHNIHSSPLRMKNIENDPRKIPEIHHNGYAHDPYYAPQYIVNHTPPHTEKVYTVEVDNYQHISSHSPHYQHPETEGISTGLGGYWVKNENNESVWVPTVSPLNTPVHWPRDKRFGSLDRRKDKFIHNKHLQGVENRKNTIVTAHPYTELVPVANIPPPNPVRSTSSQECKPLVRTQSLGSVGAQTVDISWPNDDNSSCDSDGQSFKERGIYSRRTKPKGWCETSLDGPPIPSETPNANLLEEPRYTPPRIPFPSPQTPKLLEIPAESNPSPVLPDNVELFNNNGLMDLPKNCTIVQAGQFKPYREVTKPFEMEDFYKYSTKFREKKANAERKESSELSRHQELYSDGMMKSRQLVEGYDTQNDLDVPSVVQKSIYQPLQPMKCQPFGTPK